MTLWKRFHLVVVVIVMQLGLGVQPVEAWRSRGFRASDQTSALHALVVACPDGVEFAFTIDERFGPQNLPDPVTIVVQAEIDGQPGSQNFEFTLDRHKPVQLDNYIWNIRSIVYSASDSIPESKQGNIRIKWSDFGFQQNLTVGTSAKLLFSFKGGPPPYEYDYLNAESPLSLLEIEDCGDEPFSVTQPICMNEWVSVNGEGLQISSIGQAYTHTWSLGNTNRLVSSFIDVVGRLKAVDQNTFKAQSRLLHYFAIEQNGNGIYEASFPSSTSPYFYAYSAKLTQGNFGPITLTIPADGDRNLFNPQGITFYHTYQSDDKYLNIVRNLARYVDDNLGFNSAAEYFEFPLLVAPTDIQVTAVYIDNQDSKRPITVKASAGGITNTQISYLPNMNGGLNIVELTLEDVPRGTSKLDFTIESPAGTGDAAVLTGVVVSYPCLEPADNVAKINVTNTAPVIDGAVDEAWQSAAKHPIDYLLEGAGPVSAADVSGYFQGLYDNDNLYLLVEVFDDDRQNDSGSQEYLDDEIEIHLDGNNSQQSTYDQVDDLLYIFRWNDPQIHLNDNSIGVPAGLQWKLADTVAGYRLELALPANAVGINPVANYEFGLEVQISDDDGGGGRDHKKSWNSFIDDVWDNPSHMGIGRLSSNHPPIANDDATTVNQGMVLTSTTILLNDSDPDQDTLVLDPIPVTAPLHGSLILYANGSYLYTPNADFAGTDSFIYRVSDGNGGSDTATVILTVVSTAATPTVTPTPTLTPTLTPTVTPTPLILSSTLTPTVTPRANPTVTGNNGASQVYIPIVAR